MKVYSIGRDTACDICINDSTDVISRRHAILNVTPTGKMTIVDQSHNGTYVNGIRISPNVPVPVTRKDSISFAHVARLDWNRVPKSGTAIKYAIIGLGALVCVAAAGFGLKAAIGGNSGSMESADKPAAVADTAKAQKEEAKTEEKTEKKDSETKKTEKAASSKKDDKKENKKEQKKKDKPESSSKKSSNEKKDTGSKTSDKSGNNESGKQNNPGLRL